MKDMTGRPGAEGPTFAEALAVWARIGVMSFGGPAGQIALMQREVVEARGWLSEEEYLSAVSFCMLLPGPEAMQIATYSGWKLHGVRGGIAAGLLFVLPGAMLIAALAALYAAFGAVPAVEALFLGVKATVVVVVIEALLRISRRALGRADRWMVAGLAFVAIFFLRLPYPLIVAVAAGYGFFRFDKVGRKALAPVARRGHVATTALIWGAIWAAPLVALWLLDPGGLLLDIGLFFSKLAVVTFGGAYAVLAYMAQDVVTAHGWLTAPEMLDGLGLAETTPGPLILVTEFVGYLAAYKTGGFVLGIAAAVLTLWVTFAPCFLWIFVGAPYIDWITAQPRLKGALQGITAAVVGVVLNLSLWFALHVFFGEVREHEIGPLSFWLPGPASFDPAAAVLAATGAVLLLRLHRGLLEVLGLSAALGLAWSAVSGAL